MSGTLVESVFKTVLVLYQSLQILQFWAHSYQGLILGANADFGHLFIHYKS